MTLGKLLHVDLRNQWADEAQDFTPLLASDEGLTLLGKVLGMELELEDTEVSVGNYRADIVAKDTITNDYVVIENQLAPTNHDHIGKLFTYAASFGASVLVWVAENFREEHRQAIDWFNDITVKDIEFFGIEIELLQISDSPFAPNLKIVSKPNEWTRSIRAEKQKLTKGDNLKIDYWSGFNDFLRDNSININIRKPGAQHWYDVAVGKSGVHFELTLRSNKKDIGCEVHMSDEKAKDLFHYLEKDKEEIESIIGTSMEWQELPEGKASRIIVRKMIDPTNEENWIKCYQWYVDAIYKFRKAFVHRIKSFTG